VGVVNVAGLGEKEKEKEKEKEGDYAKVPFIDVTG